MFNFNSKLCNLVEEVSAATKQELCATTPICVQRAREHSLDIQKSKTDFSIVQFIA
jgi:hypothetical protein